MSKRNKVGTYQIHLQYILSVRYMDFHCSPRGKSNIISLNFSWPFAASVEYKSLGSQLNLYENVKIAVPNVWAHFLTP